MQIHDKLLMIRADLIFPKMRLEALSFECLLLNARFHLSLSLRTSVCECHRLHVGGKGDSANICSSQGKSAQEHSTDTNNILDSDDRISFKRVYYFVFFRLPGCFFIFEKEVEIK